MPMMISPAEKTEVSKIVCPSCGERVKNVGLLKTSRVEGLVFRCSRCGAYHKVTTK